MSSTTRIPLRNRFNLATSLLIVALTVASGGILIDSVLRSVFADTTAQTLPFSQNWTNTGLITVNDNWSGVPGIIAYRGDDLTTLTGTDPQTITADGSGTPVNVIANQTNPNTLVTGGTAEFEITDPVVAFQGSGTADAPNIVITLNTTSQSNIGVTYNLRDIDGSADNAIQPVALQYRVGGTGSYTNIPAGFVADATTGPSLATLVTPVSVTLPVACENQANVQLRIITTNAVGSDEWVGVDDISIIAGAGPTTPNLSINDVSQAEGNAGTTTFTFTVSLSAPALAGGVTFDIATQDNTATTADSDYVARSLTGQTILQGNQNYSFDVTVNGDTSTEPNETFFVNVTNVTGATVTDGQGLGTINNDDVTLTSICQIQGSGSTSPVVGQSITTTGVVTGFKIGSSGGYYIQDDACDGDPNTSDGIFVFTGGSFPGAAASGSRVQVSGTVQEFIPGADLNQKPLTEIGSSTVLALSTGNPLPAPVVISAADTQVNNLENLERLEGMRVQVNSLTVVGPTQGSITESSATVNSNGVFFGVVTGVSRPFREPGINISDPLPSD